MSSLLIPQEIRDVLVPLNPFVLRWGDGVKEKVQALEGPDREIAGHLIDGLMNFPPNPKHFDVLGVVVGLGTLGYSVEVASGSAKRVSVAARYRQAFRNVTVLNVRSGPRIPGKLKVGRPKKQGG